MCVDDFNPFQNETHFSRVIFGFCGVFGRRRKCDARRDENIDFVPRAACSDATFRGREKKKDLGFRRKPPSTFPNLRQFNLQHSQVFNVFCLIISIEKFLIFSLNETFNFFIQKYKLSFASVILQPVKLFSYFHT